MGVDTLIRLPEDVTVHDVGEVIGILAGFKPQWQTSGDSGWVDVPGVTVKGYVDIPGCASIDLKGLAIDGKEGHHVMFHFEPSEEQGGRLLMPRSTPFWIAVGLGLIKFFGGSICFSDSDDKINRRCKKPRARNNPSNGKPWHDFQTAMMKINPLTKEDLDKARKFAAYQ